MPANRGEAEFPFTLVQAEVDAGTLRRNPVFDIYVAIHQAGGGIDQAPSFKVSRPSESVEPGIERETAIVTGDKSEAQAAYAGMWMRAAAVKIGLGFHPDTPAAGYEPALADGIAAEYDAMIAFCHEHLPDPYATAMEGWEEAGLVSSNPAP